MAYADDVVTLNGLLRAYVVDILSCLRARGIEPVITWDPESAGGAPVVTQAHLTWQGRSTVLSKWHFDNWSPVRACDNVADKLRGIGFATTTGGGAAVALPADSEQVVIGGSPAVAAPPAPLLRVSYGTAPGASGILLAGGARLQPYPDRLRIAPIPPPSPDPVTLVVVAVVNIIGGLFSLFGGGVSENIKRALEGLRSAIAQATHTLLRFAWRIARAVYRTFSALHGVYVHFVRPALDWIRNIAERLIRLIDRVLKPYLEWMLRMRRAILDIYERYVRPVLVVIGVLRQILAVLRILRIGFAEKLDAALLRLQQRIMQPLLIMLERLNSMGGWLNVLVTARAVLQRAIYMRTLYSYQGSWIRGFYASQSSPLSRGEAEALRASLAPLPPERAKAEFRAWVQYGSGEYALQAEQARMTFRAALP